MNRSLRWPALLAVLMAVVALLTFISSESASAATTPPTTWGPVNIAQQYGNTVTAPNGEMTVGCDVSASPGQDLITYNAAGTVVRQISRTTMIDGVNNCIGNVVVDKNATIYGVPLGYNAGGSFVFGPNLLAYTGNTLKWKYPLACSESEPAQYAVGANGNIYATTYESDGVHLIGLTPNVAPPTMQPAKILDIKIIDDCTTQLFPYKGGIMLYASSNGTFSYYSYNGSLLIPSFQVANANSARVNADGRLFSYGSVVGVGYTGVSVSAYDPSMDKVEWTTTASTPGANTQYAWLYPLAGGGVVAVVLEQRMNGSVPYTPTQWVYTVTTLNSAGTKVFSTQLPTTNGIDSANPVIVPEVNGKYLLVRQLETPTTPVGTTYPPTEPTTYVNVIDPTTNAVTYATMWQGNTDSSGGASLYGYKFDYNGTAGPITGPGTAYLEVRCYDSCPGGDNALKVYPVPVSGLGMDYPRGAVLTANTPAQPTPAPYVAMGDSYSSGQGAGTYDDGTTISTNKCYKSLSAYGRVLNRNPSIAPSLTAFAACGGAVASDIKTTETYSGVTSPQDAALQSSTKIVTITIGGNDIGFSDVITTCADPTKDCNGAFSSANNLLNAIFDNKLQTAYLDVLSKAPNAQVYILGYPPILASGSSGCLVGNNGGSTPFFSAARIQKGVTLLSNLNSAIQRNVTTVRSLGVNYQRLHYVNTMAANSPFAGHDICSSTPYFNGLVIPGDTSESFHPNARGQQAYANLVASALS